MTERQSKFLRDIIENYTATSEPVSSGLLAQNSEVSSATIRNEMAALEENGYIVQPHTSAGRIPTEKGYQLYLEKFVKPKKLSQSQMKRLQTANKEALAIKSLAKAMADLSKQTVFAAFGKHDYYYTGISNLFSQPEFHQPEAVINISSVLDALDQTLLELYESASNDVQVLIGSQNPFSPKCSLLLYKSVKQDRQALLGVLGPLRMNYNLNIGLLNYTKQLLNK